jgi:hypothetical protein
MYIILDILLICLLPCTACKNGSEMPIVALGKVRYIAICASGGHLSGSLEKAWNQTKKLLEKIKGKGLGT